MDPKEILLRLVAEIMLSDSKLRFSPTVSDAIDYLDEDELEEARLIVEREREDDEDVEEDEDDEDEEL